MRGRASRRLTPGEVAPQAELPDEIRVRSRRHASSCGRLYLYGDRARQRPVRRTLRRGSRASAQSDSDAPFGRPPRADRGGTMRRRLCQWRGGLCGTAAMRARRLRRHGLHLFPQAPLCLLEAARLHRLLSRSRQLLLAQGLLVRTRSAAASAIRLRASAY